MVKSSHSSRVAPPASSVSVVKGGAVRKRPKRAGHHGKARTSWCRRKLRKPVSGTAASGSDDSKVGKKTMDDSANLELEQFLTTGRTGRRNAMPQISDPNQASLSTAGLPLDLAKLSCSEQTGADDSGKAGKGSTQGSKPSS